MAEDELREPTRDEIDALLHRHRWPALNLLTTQVQGVPGLPGCWMSGRPNLPPEIEWPWYRSNEHRGFDAIDMQEGPN